ncbi:TAT-variant-translocated molybdopterin oxidoreductase [bacterium]|nr:TAT-variant-translocated molybdopterin oxidoreductase [bacterium]
MKHSSKDADASAMKHGKEYWLSLRDKADTPEYRAIVEREFPEGTMELASSMNRRTFMTLMGASVALAGLTSCRRPEEDIVPYVSRPEEVTPGNILRYATSMPLGCESASVLVDSREGRPVKVTGNGKNASTGSATSVWANASILELYDPDRSQFTLAAGQKAWLQAFIDAWVPLHAAHLAGAGKGLALLLQPFASPTLARLVEEFRGAFPEATVVSYAPVNDSNVLAGSTLAFGRPLRPRYDFARADVVLALDADFLGTEFDALANARAFAARRTARNGKADMNRLYIVEPTLTQSTSLSDHRLRLSAGQIPAFTAALAAELNAQGLPLPSTLMSALPAAGGFNAKWLRAVAADLLANRSRSLLIAGRGQSPAVHAVVAAINEALGNAGSTVRYAADQYAMEADPAALVTLTAAMKQGEVETLVMLGGNPAFTAPADLDFRTAMDEVKTTVYCGLHSDETAMAASWHVPLRHYLEAWGDVSSLHGHLGVIQPLIDPLYQDGMSDVELLSLLTTGAAAKGYDLVRATWNTMPGMNEKTWRGVLHEGIHPLEVALEAPAVNADAVAAAIDANQFQLPAPGSASMEIVYRISPAVHDGRYANNGWLQEFPDPITKLTWDNAALISRATAEELGVKDGDLLRLSIGGHEAPMPVWTLPGQADYTVTVTLGYGRRHAGRIGTGVGFNSYRLRRSDAMHFDRGVQLGTPFADYKLACVQDHHGLDLEDMARTGIQERLPQIYREGTVEEYEKHPDFPAEKVEMLPLRNMWDDHTYNEGHQWGMSIDLNACIGCGSCTVACQSENNIPIVGKEQVLNGREMHWIRIDRYYKGDEDNPEMRVMPVACHHCEMAPCEQVCPVAATSHDEEGLNVMTYNRCIGTRYCSNNCPYKVRRFNFYNYTKDLPEVAKMSQNPDVTVRFRGVMEKCTYCTQRITRAKIDAKREGRELVDGDITTACEDACPTSAIVFGDINDAESRVAKIKQEERTYGLLAEFNLRPRTSFLARLRNPNPALENGEA